MIEFLSSFDLAAFVDVTNEPSGGWLDFADLGDLLRIKVLEVPERIEKEVRAVRTSIDGVVDRFHWHGNDPRSVDPDESSVRRELVFRAFAEKIVGGLFRGREARGNAKHFCRFPASAARRDQNDRPSNGAAPESGVPVLSAIEALGLFRVEVGKASTMLEDVGRARLGAFALRADVEPLPGFVGADDAREHLAVS